MSCLDALDNLLPVIMLLWFIGSSVLGSMRSKKRRQRETQSTAAGAPPRHTTGAANRSASPSDSEPARPAAASRPSGGASETGGAASDRDPHEDFLEEVWDMLHPDPSSRPSLTPARRRALREQLEVAEAEDEASGAHAQSTATQPPAATPQAQGSAPTHRSAASHASPAGPDTTRAHAASAPSKRAAAYAGPSGYAAAHTDVYAQAQQTPYARSDSGQTTASMQARSHSRQQRAALWRDAILVHEIVERSPSPRRR